MVIKYDSNNSGGTWWIEDKHWRALEKAGWHVKASSAEKEFSSIEQAIREWEEITGLDSEESGCWCCGEPHHFYIK